MEGWPTDEAVEAATRALCALEGVDYDEEGKTAYRDGFERYARTSLANGGLPELLGVSAVADLLGVRTGNLDRVAGLPVPLYDLERSGRLWSAVAVREFDARRRAPEPAKA